MLKNRTRPHTYPDTSFTRPIEIEMIRQESRQLIQKPAAAETYTGDQKDAFIVKTGADWLLTAQKQPETRMLFDRFWFEGELCILFADTNVGKSVLAVQIGDSISRGQPVENFMLRADACKVLYIDFELSSRQFETRYNDGTYGHYRFSSNFLRAEINPKAAGAHKFANYEDYILNALENLLINTQAKVLIIDNITCLHNGTHVAGGALKLMKSLQLIKHKYGISILVLVHTPKRNPSLPVSRNDLQGSKMLINFCDSAFAIGESQAQPGTRYLKQIKQRSGTEAYGATNVCLCTLTRPCNFLKFEFSGFAAEASHLLKRTTPNRHNDIMALHQQGKSMRQIAAELGVGLTTVHRVVNG